MSEAKCYCTCHSKHASRARCRHCYPLVLFCGSRTWDDQRAVDDLMAQLYQLLNGSFMVIHGGAKGADDAAWFAAKKLGIHAQVERPDWGLYGRRAGALRNLSMLEKKPALVVALWDGHSKGTKHTIDNAVNRFRIPTVIIPIQGN